MQRSLFYPQQVLRSLPQLTQPFHQQVLLLPWLVLRLP
jgi:hypothetical protein